MDAEDVGLGLEVPQDPWALFEADTGAFAPMPDTFFDESQISEPQTPEVTADDYSEDEQWVLLRLRHQVRTAVNVNTRWKERTKAVSWIFVQGTTDRDGLDFRTACQALGSRPLVVQSRTQHQFYRAGIPFPEPLPFLADGLPQCFASEAMVYAGQEGIDIARFVWRWPGVRADVLAARFAAWPAATVKAAIDRLEDHGHLALSHGFWYFIGRNPAALAAEGRRSFSWAKSILGER